MDYSDSISKVENSIGKIIAFDPRTKMRVGGGSGFVYYNSGIVVTCNHVIENSNLTYFVKFPDISEYKIAKILLRDEEHDIALLEIKDSSSKPLVPFSGDVKKGIEVMFSGYPLDLADLTTHQGIISSITKDATGITTYLIDGTVNPGNSGCPLMSIDGNVIGIVNAQRREGKDVLDRVDNMRSGAISIHEVDMVDIYKALMSNLQLGIGYAIPAKYIPEHKTIKNDSEIDMSSNKKEVKKKKQ